jgi:hypothetical protein
VAIQQTTDNLENANSAMLSAAYEINYNLRLNNLNAIPDLYDLFANQAPGVFNEKYLEYVQTLTYTGNSVELLILTAIAGLVCPRISIKCIFEYICVYRKGQR